MSIDFNFNSDSSTFTYKDNVLWEFTASLDFFPEVLFLKTFGMLPQNTCATKLRKGTQSISKF